MVVDMTLSDKIIYAYPLSNLATKREPSFSALKVKDVRQFIKDLKLRLIRLPSQWWIGKEIDKLAGEELCKNG